MSWQTFIRHCKVSASCSMSCHCVVCAASSLSWQNNKQQCHCLTTLALSLLQCHFSRLPVLALSPGPCRRDWEAERVRIAAAEAEVSRVLQEQQADLADREGRLIDIRWGAGLSPGGFRANT